VRSLLANHIPLPQEPNGAVWDVLKQCCIFETANDDMTDLSHGTLQLLPNAEWEQQMLATPHLVQWKPVKHHTASDTQQTLLKHSGLVVPQLPHFLDNCLLPESEGTSRPLKTARQRHFCSKRLTSLGHSQATLHGGLTACS
jgi:hypothetical protein